VIISFLIVLIISVTLELLDEKELSVENSCFESLASELSLFTFTETSPGLIAKSFIVAVPRTLLIFCFSPCICVFSKKTNMIVATHRNSSFIIPDNPSWGDFFVFGTIILFYCQVK
jgi:hypothetical protein